MKDPGRSLEISWIQATLAVEASRSLLLTESSVVHAAQHLIKAWRLLALSQGIDAPSGKLSESIAESGKLSVSDGVVRELEELCRTHESWSRGRVLKHAKDIEALLRKTTPIVVRQARRRRWAVRAIVFLAALAALSTVADKTVLHRPWRASYYRNTGFKGAAEVRRTDDVYHNWSRNPPWRGFPSTEFSVRFDTCLSLPTATEMSFRILSRHGARVYVDDKLVLQNRPPWWKVEEGSPITVAPGTHHLRVDYVHQKDVAKVMLTGKLGSSDWGPIPDALLHHPVRSPDHRHPCGERSP